MTRREVRVCGAALSLLIALATAAVTVEIKGRVANEFTEKQYRAVTVRITDRLGTEIGRTHPDARGQYQIKITGPRFIIIEAVLDGYPTLRYQLDTQEQKESTADFEHNRVFGELRIPTYYQNITFGQAGTVASGPLSLEDLLASENPKAVQAYQRARQEKEVGDFNKAVRSLETLIKNYPDFYIGYIDLGMILAARQDSDKAIEIFTKARELRPERSWAYVGLGVALNNKQDYQNAAQHLEKAVEIDPTSVNAQFQLGQALFNLGDIARALACFQHVVGLDPRFNPMAYKYLSSIYIKRFNSEGAAQSLKAYLEHFPDASDREKVEQILKKLGR